MEVKQFRLENIGRFQSVDMHLAPTLDVTSNVTVLTGNNGAGKTTILKALATSLSWFVARLRTEKGSGNRISEEAILNASNSASIQISVLDEQGHCSNPGADISNFLYHWALGQPRKGRKSDHISQLADVSRLADCYRTALSANDNTNLPLIAFYSVERVVVDIPLKIRGKHRFLQLDGYDNSLTQGVDFRRFFEWFREREDTENESGIGQELLSRLELMLGGKKEGGLWEQLQQLHATSRDRQLTAVRSAIANFMPGFSNLKVRRKPRLHMSIDKAGQTLNVLQLSQGEKSLMALVGDIARRLAMMNPALENPLNGDGIVLIDEVDMHLHPSWQRRVIEQLTTTFPNCQFVLTTHSPLVISDRKNVLVYSLDDGELTEIPSQYGQDANTVLLGVMDTAIRNESIDKKLNDLLDLIQDRELDKAQRLLAELESELPPNHLELMKARLLLRKERLRRAEN